MDTAVHFPTTPKAVTASKLSLSRRMDVEAAFCDIMFHCIAQVRANEEGVGKFNDVECLHQMRVGLRRLRSALGMFDDVPSLPEPLKAELDWLVGELGPARDWDVLAGTTLSGIEAALPQEQGIVDLKLAAIEKAQLFHASAAAAVDSLRYTRLTTGLDNWVGERGWRQALVPGDKKRLAMRVTAFAKEILDKDQQRLLKRGRKLAGADPQTRHRVRIAAKKTRYAAEFFGSLYSRRAVRPYVEALSRLQDALGRMNDAAVAGRLLNELTADNDNLREAAVFARGYLAGRSEDGKAALKRDWKRFARKRAP